MPLPIQIFAVHNSAAAAASSSSSFVVVVASGSHNISHITLTRCVFAASTRGHAELIKANFGKNSRPLIRLRIFDACGRWWLRRWQWPRSQSDFRQMSGRYERGSARRRDVGVITWLARWRRGPSSWLCVVVAVFNV